MVRWPSSVRLGATLTDPDSATLTSLTAALATNRAGDLLTASTTGTAIGGSFVNGTLILSGSDTVAHYQQVLNTIAYDNLNGSPAIAFETINLVATDDGGLATTATVAIRVKLPPVISLGGTSGAGYVSGWSGSGPVNITDPGATIFDLGVNDLVSMTVALNARHPGDLLSAAATGNISIAFDGATLTISGQDSLANYQAVLRSVTYTNTAGGPSAVVETATVVANDGTDLSMPTVATINMPAPSLSLTAGAGSGAPNFTTTWYNQGTIPTQNNVLATVTALSGVPTLSSLKVTLATSHTGDVLSLAPLGGVVLSLTSSYSAGTLTLSGTDTVAHYQQALRFINYNNTVGGPGATPIVATFVANDGTHASNPVTATININVGSGQVLGNRLFYNNSKYDGNNGNINASDDAAIASDKTGYTGTGTATFANVSSFNKGITGIMVDLQRPASRHALGDHRWRPSPVQGLRGRRSSPRRSIVLEHLECRTFAIGRLGANWCRPGWFGSFGDHLRHRRGQERVAPKSTCTSGGKHRFEPPDDVSLLRQHHR